MSRLIRELSVAQLIRYVNPLNEPKLGKMLGFIGLQETSQTGFKPKGSRLAFVNLDQLGQHFQRIGARALERIAPDD